MPLRQSHTSQRQDNKVRSALRRVESAATKFGASRGRFAAYRYLKSVFRAYSELKDQKLLKALRRVLDRDYNIPEARNWHAIRAIIEATSNADDARMRSRWTRALEYAFKEDVKPKDLSDFFRQNDGIAGCARLAARRLPIKPRIDDRDEYDDDDEDDDEDGFEEERPQKC